MQGGFGDFTNSLAQAKMTGDDGLSDGQFTFGFPPSPQEISDTTRTRKAPASV